MILASFLTKNHNRKDLSNQEKSSKKAFGV